MKKLIFLFLFAALIGCQPSGHSQPAHKKPVQVDLSQLPQRIDTPKQYGKVTLERSKDGQFYMKILAPNGRETWRTSEMYKKRSGAIKATFSAARSLGCDWNKRFTDNSRMRAMDWDELIKEYPGLAEGRGIVR